MSLKGEDALIMAMDYADESLAGAGALKGDDGFSPKITENADNTDKVYKLDIETKDGTLTTPNLKGKDGEGSKSYTHSVKVIGTIGSGYYSTNLNNEIIEEVYYTGTPNTGLYGGWTLDRVESDNESIAAFSKFRASKDKQITATPDYISVYEVFSIQHSPGDDVAGSEYTVTYEWNDNVIDDDTTGSDTTWSSEKIASELGGKVYTSLAELGLDTTATINDIIGAMANNSIIIYKTDVFDYATEYENLQYGTVTIHKQSANRIQVLMNDKDTGNLYVGRMDSTNQFVGWKRIIVENSRTDPYSCTGYTVLTGTEDLFTLAPGHYATTKADMTYNYPITDSSSLTAHIYVLGHLNDPANNKGYRIILYFDNKGRMYRINEWWGSFSNGWKNIEDSKALVTNAQNFKIDITKNNSYWYGMFTFNFVYGTTPCEVTVAITDKPYYTVTKGQNVIDKITYTQDGANMVLGIDMLYKVYGTQVVEMPSEFGTINSLTAETYAGNTTATYNGYSAKGYTTLTELGLDGNATIANVLSKMYTGQIALLDVSLFDNYETIFPYKDSNDLYSAVLIIKSANNTRNYVKWFRKDGAREALASYDSNNAINGWFDYALRETFNGKEIKSVIIDFSDTNIQSISAGTVMAVPITRFVPKDTKIIRVEGYYVAPEDTVNLVTEETVIVSTNENQMGGIFKKDGAWCFNARGSSQKVGGGYAKIYYIE